MVFVSALFGYFIAITRDLGSRIVALTALVLPPWIAAH